MAEPCVFLIVFLKQYLVLCQKRSSSVISHLKKVVQ